MSLAKIKGSEYPMNAIFSDYFDFNIPLYQRPYSWTTEHAGELLEYFLESMNQEDESPIKKPNPYFLGSIVLIKEDDLSKPKAQVVDGQQRLITLTILLSVIRDLFSRDCVQERLSLTKRLVAEGDVYAERQDRYRLILKERDEQFFREYIQSEGKIRQLIELNIKLTDSQKNIKDNAKLFLDMLGTKSKPELDHLARFIINQCYIVVVSTPDSDSAYRIFSILNDRGMNLSHADILKSEIIGKITEPMEQKEYAELWENTEDKLGRDAFGDLFYHIRMIKHKKKLRKEILKEFRDFVYKPNMLNMLWRTCSA